MRVDSERIVEQIVDKDLRYKEDAYFFVIESLAFTQHKLKARRHVKGYELLDGVKDLMLKRYGPMAITVLEYWGIKSAEDLGNIVFHLVENKVLSKTEEDHIESFRKEYDFRKVFHDDYRKKLNKRISRMRTA